MGKIILKKGQLLHSPADLVNTLEIVLSGSIKISDSHQKLTVTTGGIIGVLETPGSFYSYTYVAAEDSVIFNYGYAKLSDIDKVIISNPKIMSNLSYASIRTYLEAYQTYQRLFQESSDLYRFMKDTYENYLKLCERFQVSSQTLSFMDEDMTDFQPDNDVPSWEPQYYSALLSMPPEVKNTLFQSSVYTGLGLIMGSIESTKRIMLLTQQVTDYLSDLSAVIISGESGDYFDLYSNLLYHVSKNPFADTMPIEATVSKMIIYMTDSPFVDSNVLSSRVAQYKQTLKEIEDSLMLEEVDDTMDKDAYEALDHSMETILSYAGLEAQEMEEFRDYLDQYKLMSDKSSTDDDARKLRRKISTIFYDIYEKAFFQSRMDSHVPIPVQMFFYFGYIDEELCGMSNAVILFDMIRKMEKDPNELILPMYDWLVSIHEGKNEPSKNEFDLDYPAYLREERNNGNIRKEEEKQLLTDNDNKVRFEIHNLFQTGNRITYGRVTTFCPLLSEHNILKSLTSMQVTPARLYEVLNSIRKVDFSCFYREVVFTAEASKIQKEYIDKEVLPNIILLPNIGIRGSLWQDTAGIRRDTPGRILISIFNTEVLEDLMLKLCGEFRWELCKHIQGVHWNDVTDPSLTAEYCDYLQFYRKNRELSADVKEKVKLQLQRAKNNYRAAFVMDYVSWVKYEANGSPRLNRLVRGFMTKYVPFSKPYRDAVASNPMYAEFLERYRIKRAQKIKTLDNLIQRCESQKLKVPAELRKQKEFLES